MFEVDLFPLLERACGSRSRATTVLDELCLELGIPGSPKNNAMVALALIKAGKDGEKVASYLQWSEFEDLCAKLLASSGFEVHRNIVLTKPRKQIDVFAASTLLSLCVDCKHYGGRIPRSSLARFAKDQTERARLYKRKRQHAGPVLPLILTLIEQDDMAVEGVPVVPLLKLPSFLRSVSPYDGFKVV